VSLAGRGYSGHLVAFAGGKQSVKVLRIELPALGEITMPSSVKPKTPLPPIGADRTKPARGARP
jgi:hypothetical protein